MFLQIANFLGHRRHAALLLNGQVLASCRVLTARRADMTTDEWGRVIDTNLTGVFYCCRAVVPLMIAAAFGQFVSRIPAPLGIGTLQLKDGDAAKGFLVEAVAVGDDEGPPAQLLGSLYGLGTQAPAPTSSVEAAHAWATALTDFGDPIRLAISV